MRKISKISFPIACAAIAALALATLPLQAFAGSPRYKFEITGQTAGATVTVRLIDTETGEPVKTAHIYAVRAVPRYYKTVPPVHEIRTALAPDGQGGFVAKQTDGTLHLAACVPGEDDLIRGEVETGR